MNPKFPDTVYENAPVGDWYILLVEDVLRRSYDVYMLLDTEDGQRIAYDGEQFRYVAEGAESPMWQTVCIKVVSDENTFLSAFKHVFVVRERLVRYE